MKMLKWLDDFFEEAMLLLLLCIMVLTMSLQIIARYFFSSSLSWSEEVTRYLFVYSGFLSASYCCKKGSGIRVDQFVQLIGGKLKHIILLVSCTVEIVFFAYLIPFSYSFVMSSVYSEQKTAALGIPMWTIQTSTLVCCVLSVFRLVEKWYERYSIIMGKGTEDE